MRRPLTVFGTLTLVLALTAAGMLVAARLLPTAVAATARPLGDARAADAAEEPDSPAARTRMVIGDGTRLLRTGPFLLGACVDEWEIEVGPGVLVGGVVTDGAAENAGIVRGDIVLAIGGQPVDSVLELHEALAEHEPGDDATLQVRHGDQTKDLTVQLGDCEGSPTLGLLPADSPSAAIARTHDVTGPFRLPLPFGAGSIVVDVVPDGPADRAGIEKGDSIERIDGQRIGPDGDIVELIKSRRPGESLAITVVGPDEKTRDLTVTLGEKPGEPGTAYLGVSLSAAPARFDIFMDAGPWDERIIGLPHHELLDEDLFADVEGVLEGCILMSIDGDSAASRAGLETHDVITAIDGVEATEAGQLSEAVEKRSPGDTLQLTIRRSGEPEPIDVSVTLGEHPDEPGKAFMGVTYGYIEMDGGGEDDGERRVRIMLGGSDEHGLGMHLGDLPALVPDALEKLHDEVGDILPGRLDDHRDAGVDGEIILAPRIGGSARLGVDL